MLKKYLLFAALIWLPAAAAAQAVATGTAPAAGAEAMPDPAPVPPPAEERPPSIRPDVPAPKKYADAWRLKAEPLDLKDAAAELGRGGAAGLERLYRQMCELFAAQGKEDKAVRLLETYRAQGGRDKLLLLTLAYHYARLGAPAEGAAVLEQLAGLLPEDREVALELANFYRLKGDAKAADDLVEARARSTPRDTVYQRELARVRSAAGDFAGAEQALRRALDESREPVLYSELAQALYAQGSLEKALEALEEGRKALPEVRDALEETAAELCYQKGEVAKALKFYKDIAARHTDPATRHRFETRAKAIADEQARGARPPAAQQGGQ